MKEHETNTDGEIGVLLPPMRYIISALDTHYLDEYQRNSGTHKLERFRQELRRMIQGCTDIP